VCFLLAALVIGGGIVAAGTPARGVALANVEADPRTKVVGNTGNDLAVTSMYEPGSVNKVIALAAALEEGVVAPDTVLQVPDSLQVADHVYSDSHSHPMQGMTASQILAESSNIGTIKIAQRLGMERLDDYLRRFGFGKQTALGLPNEEDGLLVEPGKWSGTSIGSIPIGQGISVTAMQMLFAYNVIANDGVYAVVPSPDGAWLLLAGATWRFIRADDPSVQVSYPAPGRLATWAPEPGR
jgi:cell division protein FtsI (penicillin-binding protein 3)